MVVFGFGLRRTAAVWNGMKPTDGRQQNQESNAPTTQCSSLAFRYHNLTETTLLLRIRGEIMMTDGLNTNLSYCWVTEDTLVLLCWEILKISLRQNFNTITVRKTLPVGGYSGQPIKKGWASLLYIHTLFSLHFNIHYSTLPPICSMI